jgi:pyruvate dehydrogenase E1 component beta subunit
MATTSAAHTVRRLVAEALVREPGLMVVGDAVATLGGAGGAFAGLAADHPGRVLDLPVADRAAVAFATGRALSGSRTIVELADSGRIPAVFEALAEAASIAASGEFAVPLLVRVPSGSQAGARIDRPVAEALCAIPGLTVLAPSTPETLTGAWAAALALSSPVVLLEARTLLTRRGGEPVVLKPGEARVLREGGHVTLVVVGAALEATLAAVDELAAEGISAGVVEVASLAPLDTERLAAAVRHTGRVVVVAGPESELSDRVLVGIVTGAFLHFEAPPATAPAQATAIARAARAAVHY